MRRPLPDTNQARKTRRLKSGLQDVDNKRLVAMPQWRQRFPPRPWLPAGVIAATDTTGRVHKVVVNQEGDGGHRELR